MKKGGIVIARQSSGLLTNEEIRFSQVRLVDSDGTMIGIVPLNEAKQKAYDQDMDLVLISPQRDNPVCKIMDYGKYMFDQAKREKEAKRNQKVTEVKEVQLKLSTDTHDLDFKARNARRFLKAGDRVKVVLKFRGREMAYTDRGFDVMRDFAKTCEDIGEIDREPRVEGRNMVMFLAPKK